MSNDQLDKAIHQEMEAHPDGSPYADMLHDEHDRRHAGPFIDVPDTYDEIDRQ
jgi:hypothetical protein